MMSALLAAKQEAPTDGNLLPGYNYIIPTGNITQIAPNVFQGAYQHNGIDTGFLMPVGGEVAYKLETTHGAYDECVYVVFNSNKEGNSLGVGTSDAGIFLYINGDWWNTGSSNFGVGDYVVLRRSGSDWIQTLLTKNNGASYTVIVEGPISDSINGFNGTQPLRIMGYVGNVMYYPQGKNLTAI